MRGTSDGRTAPSAATNIRWLLLSAQPSVLLVKLSIELSIDYRIPAAGAPVRPRGSLRRVRVSRLLPPRSGSRAPSCRL